MPEIPQHWAADVVSKIAQLGVFVPWQLQLGKKSILLPLMDF
jgi:hypothetical protein